MQAHTKKHPTSRELVQLHFTVHRANVEKIRRLVAEIEPDTDTIPVAEFFDKHFAGESRPAVHLRGLRTREGLTQVELAERTGINRRHLSEMENGKRPIGKAAARKLAEALGGDYRMLL